MALVKAQKSTKVLKGCDIMPEGQILSLKHQLVAERDFIALQCFFIFYLCANMQMTLQDTLLNDLHDRGL